MKQIPTVFIGTSNEGVSSLKALADHPGYDLRAVLTQPDKPVGRKQELQPAPVKEAAQKLNLNVHTSDEPDNIYSRIVRKYQPEFAVVIAFGDFLPKSFLDSLKHSCINVHYSLLPVLRGAVPVQKAILEGHEKIGVTIQIMEESMDTGPLLAQKAIPIKPNDTTSTLKEQLIPLGKELLMKTLPKWSTGSIPPMDSAPSNATKC